MNYQAGPAVASEADGGFVVAWYSDESAGSDTSTSVQARRFAVDGTPLGPELQVNSTTVGLQWMPAVAARPDGSFVVAWENGVENYPPPPVWLYDVRAQLMLGAFFYDGFETGDSSRWSTTVP